MSEVHSTAAADRAPLVTDVPSSQAAAEMSAHTAGNDTVGDAMPDIESGGAHLPDADAPAVEIRTDHGQVDDVQADELEADELEADEPSLDLVSSSQASRQAEEPVDGHDTRNEAETDGRNGAAQLENAQDGGGLSLAAALECLLFVSDQAVEPVQLARALSIAPAEAEAALLALDAAYRQEGRGLRIQVRNGRYQLVTAPESAALIEIFLNLDTSARLSAPALEALAVVAYRQPVTRAQIEAVRGVDCSGVLRSLIQRGLLEEVGRLDAPGRPVLYGVTDLFMHHFGLTALHELPPMDDADLARIEEAGA